LNKYDGQHQHSDWVWCAFQQHHRGRKMALGWTALSSNTTGSGNTATGAAAPLLNTTGSFNTATGFGALENNTSASCNTATGFEAIFISVSKDADRHLRRRD